ncbi:MAG: hypothetical protein H7196_03255 [candidate division SR1 bacterium]|nr:hypothetical protein [candidate division SR1 bacterium]
MIILASLTISNEKFYVKLLTTVILFVSLIQLITPYYISFIQTKSNYYVLENGLNCKLIRKYNNKAICKIEKDLFLKESVRILDLSKNEYQIEYYKKNATLVFFDRINKLRKQKNLTEIKFNEYLNEQVTDMYRKPCLLKDTSSSLEKIKDSPNSLIFISVNLSELDIRFDDLDSYIEARGIITEKVNSYIKYKTIDKTTIYIFLENLNLENEKEFVSYHNSEHYKNKTCD